MTSLTTYQTVVLTMLVLWLVPLMLIWARFDRFAHRRELLLVVLLCPVLLIEEYLRAFHLSPNWHFLVAVFSSLPVLLASLLSLAVTRLVLDKDHYSGHLVLLPGGAAVLASVPFLLMTSEYKSALLSHPPFGEFMQHWYLYAYMLLSQLAILWQAFSVEKRLRDYQTFLNDQVVDTHLYRLSATVKLFDGLITLAFCAAVVVLLVSLNLLPLSNWLQIIQISYYLLFIVLTLVLMEKRRYAPSPLNYARLTEPDFPEQQLRDALTRAERQMLKGKAYKYIGLRLKEFARAAEVDPTVLAVASRTLLKRNFRAFVYHYRLEYAKKILMRSDVRVSAVARRLGFDSERFLSELFVRYVHNLSQDNQHKHRPEDLDLL